jgi:hypothetical protein
MNPGGFWRGDAEQKGLAADYNSLTTVTQSSEVIMSQDRIADSDVSKPWSKKVTKRRRRSAAKDRKAIAITRVLTPLVVPAAG